MAANSNGSNGSRGVDSFDKERGISPRNDPNYDPQEQLRNALAKQMTMSPELFESIYLQPKTNVPGDLRKRFGNPTPIALLGFSVGLFPLSAAFMGWRGAGGSAVASTTASIWFGGVLLILAGIGEFLLGNTFPMVVFMGYGAHFLTFSTTFVPAFNAIGFFDPEGTGVGSINAGMTNPEFLAAYTFYPLAMCLLSIIFLVGSLRTNLVFVLIFILASIGFGCGAGAYFHLAQGNMVLGNRLTVGLGACFFGAMCLGWYLFLAVMIATMELPIPDLPVFDLSTIIKARPRTVEKKKDE